MNIPLLWVLWQHIIYLWVRCLWCREVCGLAISHIELTVVYLFLFPISTICHALHCVSSLTYYLLPLRFSAFINTVFGDLHFNCSSFTAFVCLWLLGCEASYLLLWLHTLDSSKNYSVFGQHIIYIYIILAEG